MMFRGKSVNCKINIGKWNKVFAIPSDIVENYLNKSNEVQLKVILYLLCNSGKIMNEEEISQSLNCSESEVIQSINYWKNEGYIEIDKNLNSKIDLDTNESAQKSTIQHTVRYNRPGSLYIANRIQSSKDINLLMQEAELILGRPLSNADSAVLLMLHDNDGLPVDVILMLLQYSVSIGKCGMKYIEKVGSSWAKEGIDNIEKAEKKIIKLRSTHALWKRFEGIIGIEHRAPTKSEAEAITRWFGEWNYSDEMVKESYERCVNSNGKYILKYMDSIIRRWNNQGIRTIEQAISENAVRKKRYSKESERPSYDLDEYEKYNIFDHI